MVHVRFQKTESLKVGDKIFKSAYDCELTKKDLEKAARELGETEEKKKECLKKLKEQLSNESNIKYLQDDVFLLRFLRVRKYDVKKAYHSVKQFFEIRKKHKDYFTIPQNFKSLVELKWLTVLPYTDEEGVIMFWMDLKKWGPEGSFKMMTPVITAACDIAAINPTIQINGTIGIWDVGGLTVTHVSEMLRNGSFFGILTTLLNGCPWRIKKVILLNTNRFVQFLYNLAKPMLPRKIADRVFLLGSDLNELHRHINPVLLPKALKGTLEDEECSMSQQLLDNVPYLKYERSFIFE